MIFHTFKEPYIFSSERTIQEGAYKLKQKFVPNIGILKSPKKSPFYLEAYNVCMNHEHTGKNTDKIKYMRILRTLIKKYNFMKYVKSPKYFCHLDWWYAKDAFFPAKKYKDKYGVKAKSIQSMFTVPYTVHFWRNLATHKYNLDLNADYHQNSLWEQMKRYVDKKNIKTKKKRKINKGKKSVKKIDDNKI